MTAVAELRQHLAVGLVGMLVLAVAPVAAQSPDEAQPSPVFRSGTDVVELVLAAKRGNRYLQGLTAADFQVEDEGVERELVFFDSSEAPANVALLMDISSSMDRAIVDLQVGLTRFIELLRADDQAMILGFGGAVRELVPLTSAKDELLEAVDVLFADGGTPLMDAVARGLLRLESIAGRRAIVLFTDGADNASLLNVDTILNLSGQHAVPIFVIGSGEARENRESRRVLERLAKATGGIAFFPEHTSGLDEDFSRISEAIRLCYRAGFVRTEAPDQRWHEISVRLTRRRGDAIGRTGYFAR